MFEKGNILTLSDKNKYKVLDIIDYNNITYVYLVDIKDIKNFILGKLEGNEIVEITDENEIKKIVLLIFKHLSNELKG